RRLQQPGDDADGGGFAGAVRPKESVDLPRRHLEAHIVHRRERAVALDEIRDGNHGVFRQRAGGAVRDAVRPASWPAALAPRASNVQHTLVWRGGWEMDSGLISVGWRPTSTGEAPGARSRSSTVIFSRPMSGMMAAC